MLITTSPGKPPAPATKDFCNDFQNLMGGKGRADIVPRRSPKFELGKVARWARGRGYGAIAVVGEDHMKPSKHIKHCVESRAFCVLIIFALVSGSLTISLLPHGPTAHFRLTGITLCKDIKNHAKPTSHPPELVLNHFSTPLGLSLASLLSQLFLPPTAAELLAQQGYQGRQVVLAQNSRDFVFIRRYRYMFALKGDRLGSKKKVGLERQQPLDPEEDDTIKTRFQEMGPRMTIKMRWVRRGPLGETGDERTAREKREKEEGAEAEFGDAPEEGAEVGGNGAGEDDAADEEAAAKALGLETSNEAGQPTFGADGELKQIEGDQDANAEAGPSGESSRPAKRPRTVPRKRKKPSHPLLRPPSSSPEPEFGHQMESAPAPLPSKDGKKKEASVLSTVGKTWHAGRGEGGVREAKKRQEWGWEVSQPLHYMQLRCGTTVLTLVLCCSGSYASQQAQVLLVDGLARCRWRLARGVGGGRCGCCSSRCSNRSHVRIITSSVRAKERLASDDQRGQAWC